MRSRRPLTSKPENRLEQQREVFQYDDNTVHDSLQTLSEFVEQFQYVDDFVFTTSTELKKLTKDSSAIIHSKATVDILETRFEAIVAKLPEVVTKANEADLVELITNEFDNISALLAKIGSSPPATQNLSQAHKTMYKTLSSQLTQAKSSFAAETMATLRSELRELKHGFDHEYETFFTLSSANQSNGQSVLDDCRLSVDKIISLSRLWNEIGEIQMPHIIKDIAKRFETWKSELSTTNKRSSSVSMIPKPSSLRPTKKSDAPPPKRSGKIPRRSQSASRSSEKKPPPLVPEALQEAPANPRKPRRPASAAERQRPKPVEEIKPDEKRGRVQLTEWQTMEGKFARHIAALGANDVLNRFLTELRSLAKERKKQTGPEFEQHIEKLKKAMKAIDQKVLSTKPIAEVAQRLRDAVTAMGSFVKQLPKGATTRSVSRDIDDLQKRLQTLHEQIGRAEWEARLEELRSELTLLQDAASKFAVGDTADLQQLMRENAEIHEKEEVEQDDGERTKICTEMKVVQNRIAAIIAEKKQGQVDEEEAEDLEAELEALLEQQMGLIDQLQTL